MANKGELTVCKAILLRYLREGPLSRESRVRFSVRTAVGSPVVRGRCESVGEKRGGFGNRCGRTASSVAAREPAWETNGRESAREATSKEGESPQHTQ